MNMRYLLIMLLFIVSCGGSYSGSVGYTGTISNNQDSGLKAIYYKNKYQGVSIKSPDSNVESIFGKDCMITTCVHAGNQVI